MPMRKATSPCPVCRKRPGVPEEPSPVRAGARACKKKAKVKLADGKERTIQHMMVTSFWHPDGTPMSAQQFMEMLFGKLPEFFKNEDELRELWSGPDTRRKLLEGLAEKGFGHDQLAEMQKIIDAEKSDLFDVLAHVAYALPPLPEKNGRARPGFISLPTSTASNRPSWTSSSPTTSQSACMNLTRRSWLRC